MKADCAVLGAGGWGTALANLCARQGREVLLWGRDARQIEDMRQTRRNDKRLPGVSLAPGVIPTEDFAAAVACRTVLLVTPAQTTRAIARAAAPLLQPEARPDWVICAKGFERESGAFLSDVLAQEAPQIVPAVLSGPSFSDDVARELPTAVTLAAVSREAAHRLREQIAAPHFRLYASSDLRGAQIGGAAKNVLAIACGVAQGRGLGASAVAALTARGFAELQRFGLALGAEPATLMGLSGLGDLVLCCATLQSRNFAFGHALGRGAPLAQAADGKLAEGALTARALMRIAGAHGLDMPIAAAVDALCAGEIGVDEAIASLLARPMKAEA